MINRPILYVQRLNYTVSLHYKSHHRTHVVSGADGIPHGCLAFLIVHSRQSKVDDFDGRSFLMRFKEYILGFDIAMDTSVGVEVMYRLKYGLWT